MVLPKTIDAEQAEDAYRHLEQVLSSEAFRRAPALRNLLDYLVRKSVEGKSEYIKENVLAVEVFGRRPNFDGRTDNIVRVQAHRLRKLLEVYYAEEGKDCRIRFLVPRGGYVPQLATVEDDAEAAEADAPPPAPAVPAEISAPSYSRPRVTWMLAAAFALGLLAAGAAWTGMRRFTPKTIPPPPTPVDQIWKGIFAPDARVIVSFTNPVFLRVGNSRTFLLYGGPLSAPPGTAIDGGNDIREGDIDRQSVPKGERLFFNDGWTGTGEVLAVSRLTELSTRFGKRISVLPSRALGTQDMHGSNVIFLGSPWMNGVLSQIGVASAPLYNTDDGRIVVRNPTAGERAEYTNVKDGTTSQIRTCYGLFSVLPGIDDGRTIVSSAGIGTWATWAAVDFATSEAGAAQLAKSLMAANGGSMPLYYQAIVKADLIKETASNQTLVCTRVVNPRKP